MNIVVQASRSVGGTMQMLGMPMHFDGRNELALSAAPRLGEHTSEALQALAFTPGEIERLPHLQTIYHARTPAMEPA